MTTIRVPHQAKRRVLVVDEDNKGLSTIVALLLRSELPWSERSTGFVKVRSAGVFTESKKRQRANPVAMAWAKRNGFSLDGHESQHVSSLGPMAGYGIIVCIGPEVTEFMISRVPLKSKTVVHWLNRNVMVPDVPSLAAYTHFVETAKPELASLIDGFRIQKVKREQRAKLVEQ